MYDEWMRSVTGNRLMKFTYLELSDGGAFLTAQIGGHEVVLFGHFGAVQDPFSREDQALGLGRRHSAGDRASRGIPHGFCTAVPQTYRSSEDAATTSLPSRNNLSEAPNDNGRFLRAVRLSGLRWSWRGRAGPRHSQPSASVPSGSRSSGQAPQSRTSRTASATPIETIVRWLWRSASRSDRAHLERPDR